jgi:hypothetical protein
MCILITKILLTCGKLRFIENFGPRQLFSTWRVIGFVRGDAKTPRGWQKFERKALQTTGKSVVMLREAHTDEKPQQRICKSDFPLGFWHLMCLFLCNTRCVAFILWIAQPYRQLDVWLSIKQCHIRFPGARGSILAFEQ